MKIPRLARTAAAAARRPLRLLQFSDLHLLADPDARLRGLATEASWRATRDAARSELRAADLLLLTGDLAERGESGAYRRLRAQVMRLRCPTVTLPGNHDDARRLHRHLPGTGRTGCRAVQLGGWQLLLLDSRWADRSEGRLCSRQFAWLRRARRAGERRHRLLVIHHPPLPLGSRWIDAIGLWHADRLRAAAGARPALSAVLFGHAHQAHASRRGATLYLGCPSTGTQFRPGTACTEVDPLPPGWREILLYPNGRLRTRVGRAVNADACLTPHLHAPRPGR